MAFIGGILILLLAWFIFKAVLGVVFYEDKWQKQIKKEAEELEAAREERRGKAGQEESDYDDFVGDLDNKFEIPPEPDYSQYKDPRITKARLEKFCEFAKNSDTKKDALLHPIKVNRSKLSKLITSNLDVSADNYIVELIGTYETDGEISSEDLDYNLTVYEIEKHKVGIQPLLKNKEWVSVLNNPNLAEIDWKKYDSEYAYTYDYPIDYGNYYLTEDDSKVPDEYYKFEPGICGGGFSGPIANSPEILYYSDPEVIFDKEKIKINGTEFYFLKDEKEHLITLLMASYKPSLLKRILNELNK